MALHLFQPIPSTPRPGAPIQLHRSHSLSLDKPSFSIPVQKPSIGFRVCSVSKSQAQPLYSPPSSREEAISQAKSCISTCLQNSGPFTTKKIKKQKQSKFRVEIPVIDDSPNSITKLASEIFSDLPVKRNQSKATILLIYSSPTALEDAESSSIKSTNLIINSELNSLSMDSYISCDLAVFLAPQEFQLQKIKSVTGGINPKPVILFNPNWAFEDEKDFDKGLENFVSSFRVVYSFTGLEVKGILSKKRGVILRSVNNGLFNEEGWSVMVEEGQNGDMKTVMKFMQRPSIVEVETVLYNLMAVNSPVTKSVKFIKDLVSNVTTKKKN